MCLGFQFEISPFQYLRGAAPEQLVIPVLLKMVIVGIAQILNPMKRALFWKLFAFVF